MFSTTTNITLCDRMVWITTLSSSPSITLLIGTDGHAFPDPAHLARQPRTWPSESSPRMLAWAWWVVWTTASTPLSTRDLWRRATSTKARTSSSSCTCSPPKEWGVEGRRAGGWPEIASSVKTGYVDLSNTILLSQHNEVVALDIVPEKVALLNPDRRHRDQGLSGPQAPQRPSHARKGRCIHLAPTYFGIIAIPTDYDPWWPTISTPVPFKQSSKTSWPSSQMLWGSSSPQCRLDYTAKTKEALGIRALSSRPNSYAKAKALNDNLHPSRINVMEKSEVAETFAQFVQPGVIKLHIPTLFTDSSEAEAIKLIANAYMALAVVCFKELGFDGYWLPKDTKQITVKCPKTSPTPLLRLTPIAKTALMTRSIYA